MSDQITPTDETPEPIEQPTEAAAPLPQPIRVFKTGSTRIVEDESMRGLSVAQVQALLKPQYPELANATVRESMNPDGQKVIEFLPQPGRKG